VQAELALALSNCGRAEEAAAHAESALELAASQDSPRVLAVALNTKFRMLFTRQRVIEAAALVRAMVDVAHLNDLPGLEAQGRTNLGDVLAQSDMPGAEAEHRACLDLAERLGVVGPQATALNNLALHNLYLGEWQTAERFAQRAIDELPPLGQPVGRYALILLQCARGRIADARAQLEGLEDWATSGDPQDRTALLIAQASVAHREGRDQAALSLARSAAADAADVLGLTSESFRLAWPLASGAALDCGKVVEAGELLRMVAEAPPGHVPPYLKAQLARYTALVSIARGETTGVEAGLRSAIETLTKLGYRYWLARAQADLAQWLVGQGRAHQATPLLDEAIATFTELGAQPDLDRLQASEAAATHSVTQPVTQAASDPISTP
jgi:hypothetical protein